MAGAAPLFVERASSVLIDLATRATVAGTTVDLLYAVRPGATPMERRVRPVRLEAERYLIGWDVDAEEERTYRLDRILSMSDGESTYLSPWILPEELPLRFKR
jgi:predicted DNA-binding transcriptional regulator YafY